MPSHQPWSARALSLTGSAYGTILSSSLLVALSYGQQGQALVMIAALLITELVFTSAHAWSELLSSGRRHARLPSPSDVIDAVRGEWPVFQATWPAVVALLLAALGAYSVDTGVDIALVANAAVLFV